MNPEQAMEFIRDILLELGAEGPAVLAKILREESLGEHGLAMRKQVAHMLPDLRIAGPWTESPLGDCRMLLGSPDAEKAVVCRSWTDSRTLGELDGELEASGWVLVGTAADAG